MTATFTLRFFIPLQTFLNLVFLFAFPALALANGSITLNTSEVVAEFFESSKANEAALIAFLHKMPKGADLHAHPSGSVYPEGMVDKAIAEGLFYDRTARAFVKEKPATDFFTPADMQFNYKKYNEVLDSLSIRNTDKEAESSNVHFFTAFGRFGPAAPDAEIQMREIINRAAAQKVSHLELMTGARSAADGTVDQKATRAKLEQYNIAAAKVLKERADAGQAWNVSIIWSLTLYRDATHKVNGVSSMEGYADWWRRQVSGIMEAAFQCADQNTGAITILSPEDSWIARSQFEHQISIIDEEWLAFQKKHPENTVKMNLHGGELTLEFSPYNDLRTRVSDTVIKGHASRIGHGVAIMWDDKVYELLKYMRDRKIALELCLTSNYGILHVTPDRHPFPLYWAAGVPLVLNTDDEGISRSNLTIEYTRAAQWFDLSYPQIKWLAFNSLEYSFLPGESLFVDGDFNKLKTGANVPNNSRKADHQQRLLADFAKFEADMLQHMKIFQKNP